MNLRVTTLKREEMLALWKMLGGYEPSNCDCVVSCSDGLDLDEYLLKEIDGWYATQLLEAPTSVLPVLDLHDEVECRRRADGGVEVVMKEGVLRVVSVVLAGWSRPANIITDATSPEALAQRNPFTRATVHSPVAVVTSPYTLMLYPGIAEGELSELESLRVVAEPLPEYFNMTDALLARIPRVHGIV